MNMHEYGNTSSASVPILLDELNRAGRFKKGDKLVMVGFGGGLTWGAAYLGVVREETTRLIYRKREVITMQTEVTKLLGIKYPIIQGGMAWVAEHHLAAAVSEAGGLGLIGAANAPAEWVREEIRKAKELTDKPFGVNILLMSPYADDVAKVVAEEGVKVVTTGAGNPGKYLASWKEAE